MVSSSPDVTNNNNTSNNNNNSNNNTNNFCWYRRPRLLYTAVFVWISITGGRFTASFLEAESSSQSSQIKLNSAQIGIILAIQKLVGIFAGSITGIYADKMEQQYPKIGRLYILGFGCFMGTIIFCFHGIHHLFPTSSPSSFFFHSVPWFIFLRMIYAICTSLVFPILDGICLDFLKKDHHHQQQQQQQQRSQKKDPNNDIDRGNDYEGENNDSNETAATDGYGKERLYGAISWAISNMMIGPILDYHTTTTGSNNSNNFWVLYPMSIVSTICLFLAIWVYINANANANNINISHNENAGGGRLTKRDSDIILPDIDEEEDGGDGNNNNIGSRGDIIDTFEDEPIITVPTRRIDIDDDDDDDDDGHTTTRIATATATTTTTSNTTKNKISYYISIFAIFGATNYTIAFMICLVTLSSGQAIVNDLIFLFFEFLGSSYTLMSCTVVLTVVFEIPIFHIAPYLLKKCGGCSGLLIIASLSYIIRVIGYTFIPIHKPILALFLEPLHGITYASSQTAAIDFVSTKLIFRNSNNNDNDNDNESSNNGSNSNNGGGHGSGDNKKRNIDINNNNNNNDGKEATVQGFLQLFTGIGSVLGLVFGGYIESTLGPRIMYRISAFVVMFGCTILVLVVTTATATAATTTTVSSSSSSPSLLSRIMPSSMTRNHHHPIPQTEEIVIGEADDEDNKNIDMTTDATTSTAVIEMTTSITM